jgi:alpha-L-fucosidase
VNARYAVLTAKHHDGFVLWNTRHANPRMPNYYSPRDLVGELAAAVRERGLKFGTYYSSGLDWTFNDTPIDDFPKVYSTIVQGREFADYATAHWHELIERYQPDILWGDIGHTPDADVAALFAHYYNAVPGGVVNDRFSQIVPARDTTDEGIIVPPASPHFDFRTPEYSSFKEIQATKWETCRGMAFAFFYNQNEREEHHATIAQLVHLLVDIVSKNGNLLLDIGPRPDGSVPELQLERLLGLGAWLDVNGEAIFDTSVWHTAEGHTDAGVGVRFTQRDGNLYAVLLGTPSSSQVTLQRLQPALGSNINLLGGGSLTWEATPDGVRVHLPSGLPASAAHVLKFTQIPNWAS